MRAQEVISLIGKTPGESDSMNQNVHTYPALDEFLEKGMYIESLHQIRLSDSLYMITFVLRYYNVPQNK